MDFWDYQVKYFNDLDIGEQKCKGIKRAIDAALETGDINNALKLYHEFNTENQLYYDGYESVIMFSEYLALFEKHPEYWEENSEDLMWSFKYVVGNITDFCQIPLDRIENIYRQYSEYCKRFNYNMRSYYRHLWGDMYWHGLENFAGVKDVCECHKRMMQCPIDELSEIPAGECDDLVKYILFVEDDIEKAYEKAEPIFSGKLSCPQVPFYTYNNFAIYYFNAGNLEKAKFFNDKACREMYRYFGNTGSLMFDKGLCIMICAYTDAEKALKILRRQIGFVNNYNCPFESFYMFLGAYHVFKQLKNEGTSSIKFDFPGVDDKIYHKSGCYIAVLENYYYEKAKSIAEKFDKRNRNNHFTEILNKKYTFNKGEI